MNQRNENFWNGLSGLFSAEKHLTLLQSQLDEGVKERRLVFRLTVLLFFTMVPLGGLAVYWIIAKSVPGI